MADHSVLQRRRPAFDADAFEGAVADFEFARARVPFFRREGRDQGPARIDGPADWARVPLTRRADYRADFPRGVLARGRTLGEPGTLVRGSGGVGDDRVTTAVRAVLLAARRAVTLAAHPPLRDAILGGASGRSARYTAPECSGVECASPYTPMEQRTLDDGTLVLPSTPDPLAAPDALLGRAADELRAHAPAWLEADATPLAFLLRRLAATGRREAPPVGAIVLTYTPATRVARRRIAEHCGTAVVAEAVTMSEFGWLAVECPLGLTHLNNRSYFVEPLVDGGRPAAPGELAELVVTSVGDRLSPHIRYRTGDLCRVWDDPCACGSDLPLCRFEGRSGTLLTVPGRPAPIGAWDVDRAVGDCPELDAYQVGQHREDEVRVEYVPNVKDTRALEDGLVERLRALLGGRVRLTASAVRYLPAGPDGRLRPCVSDLPVRPLDQESPA
ncbi:hypothetical protein [Actinomadura decatromicini]|uniref:Phenylacetate--CoA ligase family protein n=1 Tax=Actinomadura decatromicini TaxID=2604572 RepID=A0A5D3FX64_9ACTN|nr:hypothetical protein [Actinomadura decatromicini]TYK52496.1 hypothetical protein FXF68_01575 [Actinomadura decatromicini]